MLNKLLTNKTILSKGKKILNEKLFQRVAVYKNNKNNHRNNGPHKSHRNRRQINTKNVTEDFYNTPSTEMSNTAENSTEILTSSSTPTDSYGPPSAGIPASIYGAPPGSATVPEVWDTKYPPSPYSFHFSRQPPAENKVEYTPQQFWNINQISLTNSKRHTSYPSFYPRCFYVSGISHYICSLDAHPWIQYSFFKPSYPDNYRNLLDSNGNYFIPSHIGTIY